MLLEFQSLGLKGGSRWLEAHAVAMQEHGTSIHLAVTRDITQRKLMEEQLLLRLNSEKLLSTLSGYFINLPPDNPNPGLHDALKAVTQFIGTENGALYLHEEGKLRRVVSCSLVETSQAQTHPAHIELKKGKFPWIMGNVFKERLILIHSVDEIPLAAQAELKELFGQEPHPLAIVPILFNEEIFGLLLFGNHTAPLHWEKDLDYLIITFSQILLKAVLQGRIDRELQKSEARYRAIVEEHQTEMICRFTPDRRLTFVNEAYTRYYHCDRESLIGSSFTSQVQPEDLVHIDAALTSISRDDPISMSTHRIHLPEHFVRWQEWVIRGIGGQHNQFAEYQAVGRDITERKMMEEQIQSAQTRLAQATRLASIGQLAASVAHQISNPLTTIIADGQMLLRSTSPSDPAYESANAIVQAGWRAQRVISELMKFSQPSEEKHELVYINESIEKALLLSTAHLHAAGTVLDIHLPAVSPELYGNERQLTDLWVNLLLAPTTQENGTPDVMRIQASETPDGMIIVRIIDIGIQIPANQLASLFEPQLIPAGGKGTGVEMSICREIVRQHSGEIFVSCDDQSTTFEISLPKGEAV